MSNPFLEGLSPQEQALAKQLGDYIGFYAVKGEAPPGGLGAELNKAPPRIRARFGKVLELFDVMNSSADGDSFRSLADGHINPVKFTKDDVAKAAGVPVEILERAFGQWNDERLKAMLQRRMGTDATDGRPVPAGGLQITDAATSRPATRRDQIAAAFKAVEGK